jgi:Fic family protein
MPHRRNEIEGLQLRATYWRLVVEILKEAHRHRLPGRRFGPDVVLLLTFGAVIVSYSRGKLVRATDVARYLEIPRETARRHLNRLAGLGLLQREGKTFRPAQKVSRLAGANETSRMLKKTVRNLRLL